MAGRLREGVERGLHRWSDPEERHHGSLLNIRPGRQGIRDPPRPRQATAHSGIAGTNASGRPAVEPNTPDRRCEPSSRESRRVLPPAGGCQQSPESEPVVAFAHARTAIFGLDRKYRAGLLQRKIYFERL